LLKRHGTCWINIGDTQRHGDSLLIPHRLAIALHDDGWMIRSEIVIERTNPGPRRQEPFHRTHDMLLLLAKCRGHYCEPAVRNSVWRIPHDWRNVGGHPCPMPVSLAKDCVEYGSPIGGTVLDPFLGTGTTAIAAIEARRHLVGIELSDYYLSVARKQMQAGSLAANS
jgi:site-specific DNA-methyltransferase (adenine-specific)